MLVLEQQRRIANLENELQKAQELMEQLHQYTTYLEKESEQRDTKKKKSRYWTQSEHSKFLEALERFGPKDVKAISNFVGTRSMTQVRTHAQKYFARIEKELRKQRQEQLDKAYKQTSGVNSDTNIHSTESADEDDEFNRVETKGISSSSSAGDGGGGGGAAAAAGGGTVHAVHMPPHE